MNFEGRRLKSEKRSRRPAIQDRSALSPFTLQRSLCPRSALTLVELLVVIIILTTLVGGVIPVLSPNNDSRKIRAASRGLQGYISQIQAKAARTGRPHGIGFRETAPESGVAIEVFGLEVPPPFAGFSTASQARIMRRLRGPSFDPTHFTFVQFVLADSLAVSVDPPDEYAFDQIPPNFVRPNDQIEIDGFRYQFVDDRNIDQATGFYTSVATLRVVPVDETNATSAGQTYAFVKGYPTPQVANTPLHLHDNQLTAPKPYKIIRQPTNSSEAPYQLPSSIAIDIQGSILENANFIDENRLARNYPIVGGQQQLNVDIASLADRQRDNQETVGIMFSPTGAVSAIQHNNLPVTGTSRVVLLLGRIENGGLTYSLDNPNDLSERVYDCAWEIATGASKKDLEDLQESVNWLNLESRFLSIATTNGRVVVSEPAFVDATSPDIGGGNAVQQYLNQIEAAHGFVQEMTTVGGN